MSDNAKDFPTNNRYEESEPELKNTAVDSTSKSDTTIINRQNISKVLAVMVTLVGVAVMIGWFLDINALKSILPQFVTMKFTTALSFTLSGLTLYFLGTTLNQGSEVAKIVLPFSSLGVLLLMVTLFASVVFGINTGIEELFTKDDLNSIYTAAPGQPSIGTMISFILVSIGGIVTLVRIEVTRNILFWFGTAVVFIGGLALLGYVISWPLLYYAVAGVSSAMAVHTAILFVLLGSGLITNGQYK